MEVKTDRELLELAAKAAGIQLIWCPPGSRNPKPWDASDESNHRLWNPLTNDGDALRLAAKLHISPDFDGRQGTVFTGYERSAKWDTPIVEKLFDDPYAATRRAIVRAAAELTRKGSS